MHTLQSQLVELLRAMKDREPSMPQLYHRWAMVLARSVLSKRCPGAMDVVISMTKRAVELTSDPTTKSICLSELGFQVLMPVVRSRLDPS